jgi:hypothetical protein
VASLRSLYRDSQGAIRSASIANSADGIGGKLSGNEPKWSGFGDFRLPFAEVGFALASPVLRMKEGTRVITLSLSVRNLDSTQLNNTTLTDAFDLLITGEKGWIGPYPVSPTVSAGNTLIFQFTIPETEKEIIDYNATIHGGSYDTALPIVKAVLKFDRASISYFSFQNVTLNTTQITVEVSQIKNLILENDNGALDPKKAFLPFGPQPTKGSRFLVGYPEALAKKLSEITLTIQWKNAPNDFATYYTNYGSTITNNFFKSLISLQDSSCTSVESYQVSLFSTSDASTKIDLTIPPANASLSSTIISSEPGFITFSLEQDFLQNTYRQKYIENILKFSKQTAATPALPVLNEPYIPTIQSIYLAYSAYSEAVNISSSAIESANDDLQFFHLSYFGQIRENGYQRLQKNLPTSIPLLADHPHTGELLIGISNLKAGEGVSILFQVAEGSADPDLSAEKPEWFILCDNYWQTLGVDSLVRDTTNQLLTSGIIQFAIPLEATTENTILPTGLLWIKAAIRNNVTAVCQLIDIATNAIEARFLDNGNDPQHLQTALPSNKITKLQTGISTLKTIQQPYTSFGGRSVETDRDFYTRTSERLRHKNRCITPWDYERIILEGFPQVHQVKCIPHASEKSWLAPGHVLIVVIADLKNRNASNPLEPKVTADTLLQITNYLEKRIGMQVKIKVKNPNYQKIKLEFKVKFYSEYKDKQTIYQILLEEEIISFLSPWAYQADRSLSFGSTIAKSVLLDFVEDLPYVDYVTDFKMSSSIEGIMIYTDINEIQPQTPDTILVSDSHHSITLLP